MELNDLALNSIKYQFKKFTIDAGGKTFDVPNSQILVVKIEKDFEYSNYPFIYVGVNVPGWYYTEIIKNSNNIHITLDLHYIQYRKEFDESISSVLSKSDLSGRFLADVAIDTPILTEDLQIKYEQYEESYNKTYAFNEYYFAEFALQNETYLKAKDTVVNAVLQSTNMTTNIAYLFNRCGISNVLMSPLSNRRSHNEFIITPINAVDQLKNWILNYKLHDAGTVLFFDLERVYVISKELNCTAWRNNEYKTVHIMTLNQYSQGLSMGSGYYSNSKEKYHFIEVPPNSIQTSTIETIPYQTTNGEPTTSLTFYTNDATMEALTPNKSYLVNLQISSASTINGKYRLMRYSVEMEPGGDYMNAKFNVTLCK